MSLCRRRRRRSRVIRLRCVVNILSCNRGLNTVPGIAGLTREHRSSYISQGSQIGLSQLEMLSHYHNPAP